MGIYVLGMHRSGTSALSRMIGLLVGYEGESAPGPANPLGHWEYLPLRDAFDAFLEVMGLDWANPPEKRYPCTDEVLAQHRAHVGDLIEDLGSECWVVKDPRLCVFLDLALSAHQPDPLFVGIYRDPLEVARSLEARDGFALSYGLALWEIYNRLLLDQIQSLGLPTLWIAHSDLMAQPEKAALRLRQHLAAGGCPSSEAALDAAVESIAPEANHHSGLGDPERPWSLSPAQVQLLDHLTALAQLDSVADGTVQWAAPPITPWVSTMLETRRLHTAQIRALSGHIDSVNAQLQVSNKLLEAANQSNAELSLAVTGLRAEVEASQSQIRQLEEQVRGIHASTSWRIGQALVAPLVPVRRMLNRFQHREAEPA